MTQVGLTVPGAAHLAMPCATRRENRATPRAGSIAWAQKNARIRDGRLRAWEKRETNPGRPIEDSARRFARDRREVNMETRSFTVRLDRTSSPSESSMRSPTLRLSWRLALAALLLSPQAFACDALLGAWKSDGPRTIEYMRKHSKLEPRQEAFLSAIHGHLVMEFETDEVHIHSPDLEIPAGDGGTRPFAGMDERHAYRVLDCGERSVAITSHDTSTGQSLSKILYFDGKDAFWIYTGSSEPGAPDLHLREYFKRIDTPTPSNRGH